MSLTKKDHFKAIKIALVLDIALVIIVWFDNFSDFKRGYLSTGGTISEANDSAWEYCNLWKYVFSWDTIIVAGVIYLISIGIMTYLNKKD